MIPATPTGTLSASQIRQSSPVSPRLPPGTPTVRVTPSSVSSVSPGSARRTISPRPPSRVEVVGVGGLPALEHHVVRRVDHVVDRSHAGQGEPIGDPLRRWADHHVAENRHVRRGQRSRSSTAARAASVTGRPLGGGAGGSGRVKGSPSRAARSRAMPAMHQASGRLPSTVMSKTVSASRPSASVNGVPGAATISSPSTRRPAPSSERPSSAPGAQHPVGVDAAHFAAADLEPAGQHGADRSQGHPVPHLEVGGAADDLERDRPRPRPRPGGSGRRP